MRFAFVKVSNLITRNAHKYRTINSSQVSYCLVQSTRRMSTERKLDISGIYPPIATPFDSDENIAWDKLKSNLEKWGNIPFRGYVVQGSNGEYAYLTVQERVEMVRRVREDTPRDKLIIAGSGCESTRDTVEMTKNMAGAGADAVLVVTPCFYKSGMHSRAMINHFTKVADESPVPVILYSVPANTGIDLTPDVVIALSKHPNIIGLKDSGGDVAKLGNIVYKTKNQDFQVLAGSASFLLPAYVMGCVGGVCALANMLGEQVCQLHSLYHAGKMGEARDLQQALISPNTDVTRKFGVSGLKQAMEWFGWYGGPTRSPLVPLTSDQVQEMKTDFQQSGFLK